MRLAAEFTVRDAPPVDFASVLRTGAWMGVRPGAERATVRSLLSEPDDRDDGDRLWRYGDVELHFIADTLQSFVGHVIPDRLLDHLAAGDRVGVWTQHLDSGAHLEIERPHSGSFPTLQRFVVTT